MTEINSKQASLFDKANFKKETGPLYLFFDTETTGLPRNYQASHEDLDNWPRLVQLAWVLADDTGKILEQKSFIIKPDGFSIPAASAAIHGIDDARADKEGIPLTEALEAFNKSLGKDKLTLVAHNMNFDINIMGAEFLRAGIMTNFMDLPRVCTMESSIDFCAFPKRKFPRLSELHFKLFGADFPDAHDALVDTLACYRCFFEMKKKGIIK